MLQGETQRAEQEEEKDKTAPLTRASLVEVSSEIRARKSSAEDKVDKMKAEIKEIGGKVILLEIKVEKNLQSVVDLQNKIKLIERELVEKIEDIENQE